MNPKIAFSFTIVLALAMMLFTSPVMIMSPSIFASPSDDGGGGSSDGDDGSSENEQPEVESEPEVTEEEEKTEPELVNCPDGSQAATTEECPTTASTPPASTTAEMVDKDSDGVDDSTDNCFQPNADQKDSDSDSIGDECDLTPNGPVTGTGTSSSSSSTTNAPSGSTPADTGAVKNDICKTSTDAPFCKSSTTSGTTTGAPSGTTTTTGAPSGTTTTTGAPSGSLPTEAGSEKNDNCTKFPEAPFCKSKTTSGITTGAPSGTTTTTPTTTPSPATTTTGAPSGTTTTTPGTTTTPTTTPSPATTTPTPATTIKEIFFKEFCSISPDRYACTNPDFQKQVEQADIVSDCQDYPGSAGCKTVNEEVAKLRNAPVEGEVRINPDGSCPPGSHIAGFGGKAGSVGPIGARCISDDPPAPTTTPTPATPTTPATGTTTTPTPATPTTPATGTTTTPTPATPTTPATGTTTTPTPATPTTPATGTTTTGAPGQTPAKLTAVEELLSPLPSESEVEVPANKDGTCPEGSRKGLGGSKTGEPLPTTCHAPVAEIEVPNVGNTPSHLACPPGYRSTGSNVETVFCELGPKVTESTGLGGCREGKPTCVQNAEEFIKTSTCEANTNSPACLVAVEKFIKLTDNSKSAVCDLKSNFPGCKSFLTPVVSLPLTNGDCPSGYQSASGGKAGLQCVLKPTPTPATPTTPATGTTTTPTPATPTTPATGTTTTPTPATPTTPATGTTTTPTPATPTTTTKTVIVTKTNINNDQVTVRNDGGLTVQKLDGAVTPTADCPPQSATVVLGPSPMENGKARILAAFDPCILTSGKVLLNLPDEKGIQLVGAKIQDGQTTQSAIVPIQRIAPTAPGQAQYFIDLTEQSTGLDLVSGNPVNLGGGNVNALLLMNLGGENIQLSADNKVNMDAALTKATIPTTATQPPTLASQPPAGGGGSGG